MRRGKRLVLASHCILNQNSVVKDWERASGAYNDIVRLLLERDIGIFQLPCPEFKYLGEERPPMSKEQYDIPAYRDLCRKLAKEVTDQLKEYESHGYSILGLLGIENSPTCDTTSVRGIFMEELLLLLETEGIPLSSIDISENYVEGDQGIQLDLLREFLEENP